jgi:uncharacterized protein (TIGR02246 family)
LHAADVFTKRRRCKQVQNTCMAAVQTMAYEVLVRTWRLLGVRQLRPLCAATHAIVTGLLVVVFVVSGASAQSDSAGRDSALATVQTFIKANETRDLELIVSTFADDATVFFPGEPQTRVSGKENIRQAFAALFQQRAGTITIKPTDVAVQLFGDMAIVTAHLERPATAPGTSRRTFVVRRTGDRWLIVHHHASNFAAR